MFVCQRYNENPTSTSSAQAWKYPARKDCFAWFQTHQGITGPLFKAQYGISYLLQVYAFDILLLKLKERFL